MPDYTLSDLAALTGISPRTIRYYIAQGLIASPGREGPSTRYTETTLHRLRLIGKLRDAHLPLAAIRSQLVALDDSEVATLAGPSQEPAPEATASALDYIRSVLGVEAPKPPPAASPAIPAIPPAASPAIPAIPAPIAPVPARPAMGALPTWPPPAAGTPTPLRRLLMEWPAFEEATAPEPTPSTKAPTATGERSQWERIAITTDIELHVRRPLTRADNRLVERLIAFARQLQEGTK